MFKRVLLLVVIISLVFSAQSVFGYNGEDLINYLKNIFFPAQAQVSVGGLNNFWNWLIQFSSSCTCSGTNIEHCSSGCSNAGAVCNSPSDCIPLSTTTTRPPTTTTRPPTTTTRPPTTSTTRPPTTSTTRPPTTSTTRQSTTTTSGGNCCCETMQGRGCLSVSTCNLQGSCVYPTCPCPTTTTTTACKPAGAMCASSSECCSNYCYLGKCTTPSSTTTSTTQPGQTTTTSSQYCDSQSGYTCKPNPCNTYPQPCGSTNVYRCQDASKWCCFGSCSGTTTTTTRPPTTSTITCRANGDWCDWSSQCCSKYCNSNRCANSPTTTTTTQGSTTTTTQTGQTTTTLSSPYCDFQSGYVCKPNPCNTYQQPCGSTNVYKCQDTSKWCCYGSCSGTTSTTSSSGNCCCETMQGIGCLSVSTCNLQGRCLYPTCPCPTTTTTTIPGQTTTTTTLPCKCSWLTCNQYCGSKSGNVCLLDSTCAGGACTPSSTTASDSWEITKPGTHTVTVKVKNGVCERKTYTVSYSCTGVSGQASVTLETGEEKSITMQITTQGYKDVTCNPTIK